MSICCRTRVHELVPWIPANNWPICASRVPGIIPVCATVTSSSRCFFPSPPRLAFPLGAKGRNGRGRTNEGKSIKRPTLKSKENSVFGVQLRKRPGTEFPGPGGNITHSTIIWSNGISICAAGLWRSAFAVKIRKQSLQLCRPGVACTANTQLSVCPGHDIPGEINPAISA